MPESVSESRVEEVLDNTTLDCTKHGEKTLVVTAVLPNGFEVTVSASCVDPSDYDGQKALEICRGRVKDKVWEFLGYQQHPPMTTDVRDGDPEVMYPPNPMSTTANFFVKLPCGHWGWIDRDQWAGDVSIVCGNCDWHDTRDLRYQTPGAKQ